RAGLRPIADGEGVVVSPVDGRISEIGVADGGRMIQCKGLDYTVKGLLADPLEARALEGGAYVTLYLAPHNYHRIHAPAAGRGGAARLGAALRAAAADRRRRRVGDVPPRLDGDPAVRSRARAAAGRAGRRGGGGAAHRAARGRRARVRGVARQLDGTRARRR